MTSLKSRINYLLSPIKFLGVLQVASVIRWWEWTKRGGTKHLTSVAQSEEATHHPLVISTTERQEPHTHLRLWVCFLFSFISPTQHKCLRFLLPFFPIWSPTHLCPFLITLSTILFCVFTVNHSNSLLKSIFTTH